MSGRPDTLPAMSKQVTPKTMSSRLMTMKFMQRGAAMNSTGSAAGSPTTPRNDDEGSASKRRKLSRSSVPNTPKAPATPLYDQKAIQAALEEEERKRQAAIEKRAAELGDSHWVLHNASASTKNGSHRALDIVQVGFAQIDSLEISGEDTGLPGGESQPAPARFRQFNMKKAKVCFVLAIITCTMAEFKLQAHQGDKAQQGEEGGASSDENDVESDESSSQASEGESDRGRRNSASDGTRKRARSSLSTRRDGNRRKSQELARERRKKEVNLNRLTSISSARLQQSQPSRPTNVKCHACGKTGHMVASCPKRRK